tara:strand:+ start:245 stop:1678 length:1434 start_codon:yes stop_codon:yes gene_type:complete
MIKNFNFLIITLILLSFIFSISISNYNLSKYDVNVVDGDRSYHKMIKTDPHRYLSNGAEIKNQLKDGKNFFTTGGELYTKYLPSRLAAIYYYIFDINFSDDNKPGPQVNTGNHFYYLLIQNLIYYFSIFFLYFSVKKNFNQIIVLSAVIFLCIEPTIFQYHSAFWSESIFFSLQVIIMALIFKEKKSIFSYFLIGLFVGILSLQKQLAIFYIVPIVIFIFFFNKNKPISKLLLIMFGFGIIQTFLGLNNYYRSGVFYIMTADTKVEMHRALVRKVIMKADNISSKQFNEIEGVAAFDWIKKNEIKIDENSSSLKISKSFMSYRESILNEKDKVSFDGFIRQRTFEYIFNYPWEFTKHVLKQSIHTTLLNPFHIYSEHNFRSSEIYYVSKKHDQLVPLRVAYSLFIFLIVGFGLLYFFKKKEYEKLFFILISALYFYATIFWHGNTRYFVPCVIYLSFLFGAGLNYLIEFLNKKLNKV